MLFDRISKLLALKSSILFLILSSCIVSAAEQNSNVIDNNDKPSFSRKMVDILPSAQFDYGYIAEREIEKLGDEQDIDLDMLKKAALERQQNIEKASSMSLLDINNMLGTGSKTFKQSQVPHTHYLGSEVHLHLMHIDYAKTLMNHWEAMKSCNKADETNNIVQYQPLLGQINHEDVGFYLKHEYESFCENDRIGICISSFPPALKGLYTLNLYIQGLHSSLDINSYDVNQNYRHLMAYKHQLEHIISHNLLDTSLVGLKEAQERELKKTQPSTYNVFEGVEITKKPLTEEQIARIKEAARSSHSVVLQANSEDKIDVMVSLDDLPYGYVDSFQKNVKKFKPEYILNQNIKEANVKEAKHNENSATQEQNKLGEQNLNAQELKKLAYEKAKYNAKLKAQAQGRAAKRIPMVITERDIEIELDLLNSSNQDYALASVDGLPHDQSKAHKKGAHDNVISSRGKFQSKYEQEIKQRAILNAAYHSQLALMDAIKAKDTGLNFNNTKAHISYPNDHVFKHIIKNPVFEKGSNRLFQHSILFRNDRSKCSEQAILIIGTSDLTLN